MRARDLGALGLLLPGAVLSTLGCDDVPFAQVELLLGQPEGVGDRSQHDDCERTEPQCLQLSRSLDGGADEGVTLGNDYRGPTAALPLGRAERRLELELFTGEPGSPSLLGRADAILVPRIGDDAANVQLVRPVLFAAFNRAEALVTNAPASAARSAACADEVGNAWFVALESHFLPVDRLRPEGLSPALASGTQHVACAAQVELPSGVASVETLREPEYGRFYAFAGNCGGAGGTLRSGTDDVEESTTLFLGNGCNPQVAVRGDHVWVVQDDHVSAHQRDSLDVIDQRATDAPAAPFVDAGIMSDGTLLVAEAGNLVRRFSLDGPGDIGERSGPPLAVVRFFVHEDKLLALTTSRTLVDVDDGTASTVREVSLPGISAITDAVMLRDGTVVALGPEGIAVEGTSAVVDQVSGHDRTTLTVSAGSAVLLWGGADDGVDVFVPPLPELLADR